MTDRANILPHIKRILRLSIAARKRGYFTCYWCKAHTRYRLPAVCSGCGRTLGTLIDPRTTAEELFLAGRMQGLKADFQWVKIKDEA